MPQESLQSVDEFVIAAIYFQATEDEVWTAPKELHEYQNQTLFDEDKSQYHQLSHFPTIDLIKTIVVYEKKFKVLGMT